MWNNVYGTNEDVPIRQKNTRIISMLETWEKSYNFYGIKTYEAEGKHWDQTTP
jgi:hypothetical protein